MKIFHYEEAVPWLFYAGFFIWGYLREFYSGGNIWHSPAYSAIIF